MSRKLHRPVHVVTSTIVVSVRDRNGEPLVSGAGRRPSCACGWIDESFEPTLDDASLDEAWRRHEELSPTKTTNRKATPAGFIEPSSML